MKVMTKSDYEQLIGSKVSDKDFGRIHEIFMACGGHNKYEFCNAYPKDKDIICKWVIDAAKSQIDLYADEAAMYKDSFFDALRALIRLDKDCSNIEAHDFAVKLAGIREVIRIKIIAGLELRQDEINYLNEILRK